MSKTRKLIGKLLGPQVKSAIRDYSDVPGLLAKDLRNLIEFIQINRKYQDDPEVLLGELRTSAHIVDKGLQANDWQAGRSQMFYRRMCEQIDQLKTSEFTDDPSYQWAVGKQQEYNEAQTSGPMALPLEEAAPEKRVSKEALVKLILGRRSTRSFLDRPLETETIKELANVVNWSPTSRNRQPAKIFATQNLEKVAASLQQCTGATCIGPATPCFMAVCADKRLYKAVDRDVPLIDVSLGLQNMLLLAHAQGIEATLLNWMHHTPEQDAMLRKTLGIPEYYRIIVNVIAGYPAKSAPTPERKSCDLACTIVE